MQFVTAGESHGPALTVIVSDVPAGVIMSQEAIDADLARRQKGYGRGGRMAIEHDVAQVESGVRFGCTIGSPVTLRIENRDNPAWEGVMDVFGHKPADLVRETHPRPGHADLVGTLKTASDDCRDILERSSARETAARVAAGTVARAMLLQLGVEVGSYVTRIGAASFSPDGDVMDAARVEASDVRCPDDAASAAMRDAIDDARGAGQSLGGWFRVTATGLVPGLGSYADPAKRLTSRLGGALFSIPAIKGVEFGIGFRAGELPGGSVHDGIVYDAETGISRSSNRAGGLEGGMTNGQTLVITACMKPIPTMREPLATVDLDTLEPVAASRERSDVCAVPAAAVVAEAMVALVLADAYEDKFGHDDMDDITAALAAYRARIAR